MRQGYRHSYRGDDSRGRFLDTHPEVYVRTNIVLDDKLVREAMKLANVTTKREAVDVALRRFVLAGRQRRLLALEESPQPQ